MTLDWNTIEPEIARKLGVRLDALSPSARAALPFVRASFELADLQSSDVTPLLTEWLRMVDPSADEEAVTGLRSAWRGSTPEWIAVLPGAVREELPGHLVILLLLRQLREDGVPERGVWLRLDQIAKALDLTAFVNQFWGWLVGGADDSAAAMIEGALVGLRAHYPGPAARVVPVAAQGDYTRIRKAALQAIEQLTVALDGLNFAPAALPRLRDRLARDRFRLAVLGEFKRGKSTLINAMVGHPGLMPADILPCTSALIELVAGRELSFEVNADGPAGTFRPSDERAFHGSAAAATTKRSTAAGAARDADLVPMWRVTVPSELLSRTGITVIDTPGLNEDPARDRIAKMEAERADAAIITLNVNQLGSQIELAMIEEMKAKANDIFLVVNKSDLVAESEWPRLQEHLMLRVRERTTAIDADRVVFVSAQGAVDAIDGGRDDSWLRGIAALRERLVQRLSVRAGAVRLENLRRETEELGRTVRSGIDRQVDERRRQLEQLDQLDKQCALSKTLCEEARRSVDNAVAAIRGQSRPSGVAFGRALSDAVPRLFEQARAAEGETWTSDIWVETSPKKHIEEVAKKAQASLVKAVEAWLKAEGAAELEKQIAAARSAARSRASALDAYLDKTGTGTLEQLDQDVFMQTLVEGNPAGALMGAAAGGAAGLVVGYIVADIVLYYVLGVISSFLNPGLLAAAVVVGVGAYVFKGREWVRGWVRGKVGDEIATALATEKVRMTLESAARKPVEDILQRYAIAFEDHARRVVAEVRHQQERAERELAEVQGRVGKTPEALGVELQAFEARAGKARAALAALEQAVQ